MAELYPSVVQSVQSPTFLTITLGLVTVSAMYLAKLAYEQIKFLHAVSKIPSIPVGFSQTGGNLSELVNYWWNSKSTPDLHSRAYSFFQGLMELARDEGITRFRALWFNVVFVYKPETVEAVFGGSTNLTKSTLYSNLSRWLGTGLLTSTGSKWKSRRKMLNPSFHYKVMEDFLPILDRHSRNFVKKIGEYSANGKSVDIVRPVSLFTLDTVCETFMGTKIGALNNENADFVKAEKVAGIEYLENIYKPWLWVDMIFQMSKSGRNFNKQLDTIHSFTRKMVQDRKKILESDLNHNEEKPEERSDLNQKRPHFLDMMLKDHYGNGDLSLEDIREEVDTFTFAGNDTTGIGISFTLYLLGLHMDVQEEVREEVDTMFESAGDREINGEDLKQLRYMDCVIKEGLRLYPSVPIIGRKITEEVEIGGYKVPKGTDIFLDLTAYHRNPEIYPNPEKFDPERFRPGNNIEKKNYAYIPFAMGPRNCIAQKFALLEIKMITSYILHNYVIRSLDQRDELVIIPDVKISVKDGLKMTFTPRAVASA